MKGAIKSRIRRAMAWGYHLSGHFLSRLQGKVVILTYHRVLSEKELNDQFVQPGMYVREDIFEMQMEFLRAHFEILPLADLLERWRRRSLDQQKRYCVITFDDGWLDNYLYAYPVLRRHHLPATIFLPTDFIGTEAWFWPERVGYLMKRCMKSGQMAQWTSLWDRYLGMKAINESEEESERIDSFIERCKEFPEGEIQGMIEEASRKLGLGFPPERLVMNWEEVEEMSAAGVSFGSHSATHTILTKLSREEMRNELEGSFKALQRGKVAVAPVFCYPNGSFNHAISEQVKEAGYQAAVTTRFGFESGSPEDLFELKRIGVHHGISATVPLFSWHLSGLNHLFR